MTETTTPEHPQSPEETEALRRLSQIPPALVSAQLRSGVLEVAHLKARVREMHEARDVAQDAMRLALHAGDMPTAQLAAERLAGLERLIPELPVPEDAMDIHEVATPGLETGATWIRTALATLPPDPAVAYQLEVEAWRSIPQPWQAVVPVPICTDAERAVVPILESWRAQRAAVIAATERWFAEVNAGKGEPLGQLATVVPLVDQAAAVTASGADVVEQVLVVNHARREQSLEWSLRADGVALSSYTSPAIRVLQRHRERREPVPAC